MLFESFDTYWKCIKCHTSFIYVCKLSLQNAELIDWARVEYKRAEHWHCWSFRSTVIVAFGSTIKINTNCVNMKFTLLFAIVILSICSMATAASKEVPHSRAERVFTWPFPRIIFFFVCGQSAIVISQSVCENELFAVIYLLFFPE